MKRTPPIVLVSALLLLGLAGPCAAQAKAYQVDEGLTYSTAGNVELLLDVAWPAKGTGPFPLVVFLPGNGWGWWPYETRSTYYADIREAAKRGYAAAAVDYRSTRNSDTGEPGFQFPAQLYDVKAALRWLRAHAEAYRVDPDHAAIVGYSSGGHLGLLAAVTDARDGLEGEGVDLSVSSRIQAIVSISAPVDLATQYATSQTPLQVFTDLIGATPREDPRRYRRASPLSYISADDPPVLIIQGDADPMVPADQARLLDKGLAAAGVPHQLIIRSGGKHENVPLDETIWDFLARNLR